MEQKIEGNCYGRRTLELNEIQMKITFSMSADIEQWILRGVERKVQKQDKNEIEFFRLDREFNLSENVIAFFEDCTCVKLRKFWLIW